MFAFFRKDQGGEEASRAETVGLGVPESASTSPRPAADEPVVPIDVRTDEQALTQVKEFRPSTKDLGAI